MKSLVFCAIGTALLVASTTSANAERKTTTSPERAASPRVQAPRISVPTEQERSDAAFILEEIDRCVMGTEKVNRILARGGVYRRGYESFDEIRTACKVIIGARMQ